MLPREPLRLAKLPVQFKGVFSDVYVCRDASGMEFLFKHAKSEKAVLNELLAHKLAGVVGVSMPDFLESRSVDGRDGLLMTYLKDDILLAKLGGVLSRRQLRELQRIVVFDLLVGNRDRHSANVLVGEGLVAFDHGRIFIDRSSPGIKFVKLDIGRFLDEHYIDKVEKISSGTAVSTRDFLVKHLCFHQEDFDAIKRIKVSDFRRAVDGVKCSKNVRDAAYRYMVFRQNVFDTISYC